MSEARLAELQQKAGELEAALRQMRGELARLVAIEITTTVHTIASFEAWSAYSVGE